MDILSILIVSLFMSVNILFFILGYFLCFLFNKNTLSISGMNSKSDKSKKQTLKNSIDIDDKKIVTNIKIDNLEKKYENIAQSTTSNENISSSINKLKSMKG